MRLICDFDFIEIEEKMFAIPVVEGKDLSKKLIEINDDTKEVLKLIKESVTPEEVLEKLIKTHPHENKDELANLLCDFLNILLEKGFLKN